MSALDARIRRLAREEFETGGSTTPASDGSDRVAELEKEVADLRARLEKLEAAATPAARRTARKEGGDKHIG